MRRLVAIVCIAALTGGLMLGLAGCGDDSGSGDSTTQASTTPTATTQDQANAAFCASLVDVQAAVTDVKNLDPSTVSVSSLTTTATTLTTALSQLAAGAKDAVGIDSSELQSALTQLKDDLLAIPGNSQGLSAGVTDAKEAVVPVQNALDDVAPECPTTGGTTTG
jgi:hypothetical protein